MSYQYQLIEKHCYCGKKYYLHPAANSVTDSGCCPQCDLEIEELESQFAEKLPPIRITEEPEPPKQEALPWWWHWSVITAVVSTVVFFSALVLWK